MPFGSLQPTHDERELYENYDAEKNEKNLSKVELFLVEVYTLTVCLYSYLGSSYMNFMTAL